MVSVRKAASRASRARYADGLELLRSCFGKSLAAFSLCIAETACPSVSKRSTKAACLAIRRAFSRTWRSRAMVNRSGSRPDTLRPATATIPVAITRQVAGEEIPEPIGISSGYRRISGYRRPCVRISASEASGAVKFCNAPACTVPAGGERAGINIHPLYAQRSGGTGQVHSELTATWRVHGVLPGCGIGQDVAGRG